MTVRTVADYAIDRTDGTTHKNAHSENSGRSPSVGQDDRKAATWSLQPLEKQPSSLSR